MTRERFLSKLTTAALGRPLHYFDETDSTNTRAMQALLAGSAGHGALFVAGRQTAGRGTDGSRWVSEGPVGLWMSLVVEFDPKSAPALALWPGVAVATALNEACGVEAHLKWPNDVLVGPRKIAGVLIESVARQGTVAAVVGIGINLNQSGFDDELAGVATSVRMEGGDPVDLPVFFGRVMSELEGWWTRPADWPRQWLARSKMVGRRVQLKQSGASRYATVEGLTDEGFLLVRDDSGRPQIVISRGGLDVRVDWDS